MTGITRILLLLWLGSMIIGTRSYAQDTPDTLSTLRDQALNVFLDFDRGDQDFIRTEITYVNYVRDRTQADVHILATTQRSGSGGREYTFTFLGQNNYVSMDDTLAFFSNQTATEDEIRRGYTRVLKMGLMRYVARTPLANQIDINFKQGLSQRPVKDRWNYWVFRVNLQTFLNGEQRRDQFNLDGSISANRVTVNWKTRLSLRANYNESNFTLSDNSKVQSTRQFSEFRGLQVKSLGDHWSLGVSNRVSSSTFNNRKLSVRVTPALEYKKLPLSGIHPA